MAMCRTRPATEVAASSACTGLWFSENPSTGAQPQDGPVFRSSTTSLRGPEPEERCVIRTDPTLAKERCCQSTSPGSPRPASEKRPVRRIPHKAIMAVIQLNIGAPFRRRDVRTDDGLRQGPAGTRAHPTLGSPPSARLLLLARGVTLACLSASPSAYDSDGNSPRIFGGGETSRLH